MELGGTVHAGRLIEILGHVLESGQKDQHRRTKLPDLQDYNDTHRPARGREPCHRLYPDNANDTVDKPVLLKQESPQHRHRHISSQQGRNIVGCPEKVNTLQLKIQYVCNKQGKRQL